MINYSSMREYMASHGISQYYLSKHGTDNKTIYNLKRNKNITMLILKKLCWAMNCEPGDIVKFVDTV